MSASSSDAGFGPSRLDPLDERFGLCLRLLLELELLLRLQGELTRVSLKLCSFAPAELVVVGMSCTSEASKVPSAVGALLALAIPLDRLLVRLSTFSYITERRGARLFGEGDGFSSGCLIWSITSTADATEAGERPSDR